MKARSLNSVGFLLSPLIAFLVPIALTGAEATNPASHEQVTFSKDISPIFQAKCQECHQPNSIAPMSLITFADARPWARSIKERVATHQMPPWHIDRSVGVQKFKNDMSLNDEQVATIVRWVDEGAPEGEYVVPLGVADVKRTGTDVTIVATGWMVKKSLAAAEMLLEQGISAEVIDPRTLTPLDVETILKSVRKTGRLVLVDQATRHASAAAIIAAEMAEHGLKALKAPVKMVTALDTPIPFSEPLESYVLPNEGKIVAAVKSVVAKQAATV